MSKFTSEADWPSGVEDNSRCPKCGHESNGEEWKLEYQVGHIDPRFGLIVESERLVALMCPKCLTRFKVQS